MFNYCKIIEKFPLTTPCGYLAIIVTVQQKLSIYTSTASAFWFHRYCLMKCKIRRFSVDEAHKKALSDDDW